MKLRCPICSIEIIPENINVSTDIALCQKCNESFTISKLFSDIPDSFNIDNPPIGVKYENTFEGKLISSPTRSPYVFVMVPFMILWSGFSLGSIYGGQIASGEFNLAWTILGLPFVIGTLIMLIYSLMCIFGTLKLKLFNNELSIFTGFGSLGWHRQVKWSDVDII